jgi:hypothetical protein
MYANCAPWQKFANQHYATGVRKGQILLKNSIIWMGEYPVENQINPNFTCKYLREFTSDFVRTDRD